MGQARTMPCYQHCLSEDHGSTGCPQNPNPFVARGRLAAVGYVCRSPQSGHHSSRPTDCSPDRHPGKARNLSQLQRQLLPFQQMRLLQPPRHPSVPALRAGVALAGSRPACQASRARSNPNPYPPPPTPNSGTS